MIDLQAVEIELAVVDRGTLLHGHATAVVAAVAHRDLDGGDLLDHPVVLDRHREGPDPAQHPHRRHRVAEHAPGLLRFGGQLAGELRREADARHVEVVVAVDPAEIHRPRLRGRDEAGRRQGVERQVEGAGEVVGRAERQDREGQTALHQGGRGVVHGAVAAAEDHEVDRAGPVTDHVAAIGLRRRLLRLDAARPQDSPHLVQIQGAVARLGVAEQQGPTPLRAHRVPPGSGPGGDSVSGRDKGSSGHGRERAVWNAVSEPGSGQRPRLSPTWYPNARTQPHHPRNPGLADVAEFGRMWARPSPSWNPSPTRARSP